MTITTVAGTATPGFSGDGGPASLASLHLPYGAAVDSSGNLFIADSGNNRVREVNCSTGAITVAGGGTNGLGDGGPATTAQLDFPASVAIDTAGDIFIADQNEAHGK